MQGVGEIRTWLNQHLKSPHFYWRVARKLVSYCKHTANSGNPMQKHLKMG